MPKNARAKKRLAYKRQADKIKSLQKQQQVLETRDGASAAQIAVGQATLAQQDSAWAKRVAELEEIQRFYEARFGPYVDLMEDEDQVVEAHTASGRDPITVLLDVDSEEADLTQQGPPHTSGHTVDNEDLPGHDDDEHENEQQGLVPQYTQVQHIDETALADGDEAEQESNELEDENHDMSASSNPSNNAGLEFDEEDFIDYAAVEEDESELNDDDIATEANVGKRRRVP